jgi:DNA-binding IclR family transcriptional regulator
MKVMSVSVVVFGLAIALAGAPAQASGNAAPVLELPATLTSSGKAFLARCDDKAFATASDPRQRAERCEKLLAQWRAEAAWREQRTYDGKVNFGAPRGISPYPPSPNVASR